MTPKSLLRHPRVVSNLEECAKGIFQKVIPNRTGKDGGGVERVILCCGQIYHELDLRREELKRADVAIVRIEQLYPFPIENLRSALASYPDGIPHFWVQEEPENMGCWYFLRATSGEKLLNRFPLSVISRPESASPGTGSASRHKKEQEQLIAAVFGGG
jgi:2-oxoglutarate dehydrogenase E1 component